MKVSPDDLTFEIGIHGVPESNIPIRLQIAIDLLAAEISRVGVEEVSISYTSVQIKCLEVADLLIKAHNENSPTL
jgi:hypothetical protein